MHFDPPGQFLLTRFSFVSSLSCSSSQRKSLTLGGIVRRHGMVGQRRWTLGFIMNWYADLDVNVPMLFLDQRSCKGDCVCVVQAWKRGSNVMRSLIKKVVVADKLESSSNDVISSCSRNYWVHSAWGSVWKIHRHHRRSAMFCALRSSIPKPPNLFGRHKAFHLTKQWPLEKILCPLHRNLRVIRVTWSIMLVDRRNTCM
jgi:hypothetical protein